MKDVLNRMAYDDVEVFIRLEITKVNATIVGVEDDLEITLAQEGNLLMPLYRKRERLETILGCIKGIT